MKRRLAALLAVVALAGCASSDPYRAACADIGFSGPGVSKIAHRAPNLTPEEQLLLRGFDSLVAECERLGKEK